MDVAAEAARVFFKSPPEWACGMDTLLFRADGAVAYETVRKVVAILPLDEWRMYFVLAFRPVTTWYEGVAAYGIPQGSEGGHRAPDRG